MYSAPMSLSLRSLARARVSAFDAHSFDGCAHTGLSAVPSLTCGERRANGGSGDGGGGTDREEEPNRMGAPQCVYVVFEW